MESQRRDLQFWLALGYARVPLSNPRRFGRHYAEGDESELARNDFMLWLSSRYQKPWHVTKTAIAKRNLLIATFFFSRNHHFYVER